MAKNLLTRAGLEAYKDELQHLKVTRRREVAEKLKEARAQGDLSENAEYDAAKDEQRDIEARIEEIENILANSVVVEESDIHASEVTVGCTVKLLDVELSEERTFKVVGSMEANSLKGKISNESPLGMAILNKTVGETVMVNTPIGELPYKILDIYVE